MPSIPNEQEQKEKARREAYLPSCGHISAVVDCVPCEEWGFGLRRTKPGPEVIAAVLDALKPACIKFGPLVVFTALDKYMNDPRAKWTIISSRE